jgi:hypothetical protein
LREWLGRAGSVKMCSRREEDTNGRVGASEWRRRRGYLRKTDDKTNKRMYQFSSIDLEDDGKGTGTSRSTLQLGSRLLLGRASEARRFATRNDIIIGIGL